MALIDYANTPGYAVVMGALRNDPSVVYLRLTISQTITIHVEVRRILLEANYEYVLPIRLGDTTVTAILRKWSAHNVWVVNWEVPRWIVTPPPITATPPAPPTPAVAAPKPEPVQPQRLGEDLHPDLTGTEARAKLLELDI